MCPDPPGDAQGPAVGGRFGRAPLLVVYRALGLGDLLTAVPALRGLRAAYPRHRIMLAAPAALAPLAKLTGAVDSVVDTRALQPLPAALEGADIAVNLHGAGAESHHLLLAARPQRLLAFRCAGVFEDGPEHNPDEHEVDRWCRLLAHYEIAADPAALDLSPPLVPVPPGARNAVVIHPGAASRARQWPVERFAFVARARRNAGDRVVITGSAAERRLANHLTAAAGLAPGANLAGRTDLLRLAAVIGAARAVVCGDTGVAHLATALGTPSVVLFGPTSPAQWGPPADRPQHAALWAGQTGNPHAGTVDAGLRRIGTDAVLAALARVTGKRAPRSGRPAPAIRPPAPAGGLATPTARSR